VVYVGVRDSHNLAKERLGQFGGQDCCRDVLFLAHSNFHHNNYQSPHKK
jgi:hypothetical protein